MNAIYYGTDCWTGNCTGPGPWVGGDLENGMYFLESNRSPARLPRCPTPSRVSLRLAAPSAVADALHIADAAGTNLSGNVSAPSTGGWQDWTTVTVAVSLPAGIQTLTLDQDNGGWNVHFMSFASSG